MENAAHNILVPSARWLIAPPHSQFLSYNKWPVVAPVNFLSVIRPVKSLTDIIAKFDFVADCVPSQQLPVCLIIGPPLLDLAKANSNFIQLINCWSLNSLLRPEICSLTIKDLKMAEFSHFSINVTILRAPVPVWYPRIVNITLTF